jgi:NAD+ synthase (glutamine-hydrolysing)
MTSFIGSVHDHRDQLRQLRRVPFQLATPVGGIALRRCVEQFSYVPVDPATRNQRCAEAYIQVQGLTGW